MGAHLDRVIANCASSRFALRTLRAHGLPTPELHLVTRMATVSSSMFASPSWWGFTDASDRSRLERQLASLRRAGFLPSDFPSFDELARNADAGLFRSICSNPDHVLRHYFTDKRPTGHNLRPLVAHSFALPSKDPGTLFLGPYMEPCSTAIKTVYQLNYMPSVFFSFLVCLDLYFLIIFYFLPY